MNYYFSQCKDRAYFASQQTFSPYFNHYIASGLLNRDNPCHPLPNLSPRCGKKNKKIAASIVSRVRVFYSMGESIVSRVRVRYPAGASITSAVSVLYPTGASIVSRVSVLTPLASSIMSAVRVLLDIEKQKSMMMIVFPT